jgi:hypothetical protein
VGETRIDWLTSPAAPTKVRETFLIKLLVDSEGLAYGVVRIVKDGAATLYEAEMRGRPLGRRDRLKLALEAVHAAYDAAQPQPK